MLPQEVIFDLYDNSDKSVSGGSRFVYPISSDIVMKMPICLTWFDDLEQSINELYFYQHFLEPRFQHLVANLISYVMLPINPIEGKPDWYEKDEVPILFMERVEPITEELLDSLELRDVFDFIILWYGEEEGNRFYQEIVRLCNTTGLVDLLNNETNWGITKDGRMVCLDCGIVRR